MFVFGLVSRFMHNPTVYHLGATGIIMHYIRGTLNFGIWFKRVTNFKLYDFSDGDWAKYEHVCLQCLGVKKAKFCSTFSF